MMMFFADELMNSEKNLRISTTLTSREKVAYALARLIKANGFINEEARQIDLGLNFKELSNFAGISYTTLTRVLKSFLQEGILKKSNGNFYLVDESVLSQLSWMEIQ